LSPFAVELAVGNVGVAGCKPLNTWLTGLWLFFDQVFLVKLKELLSTLLWALQWARNSVGKPVDKSVIKLWKDRAEGRRYWLGAIAHPVSAYSR